MRIEAISAENPDFVHLCERLDEYLNARAGGEENRAEYIPHNALDDIRDVFVAYSGGKPVGCAAFREYEPGVAEVKRVFVEADHRGRGVAGELMEALEARAGAKGYKKLILETGAELTAAMRFYQKLGYRPTERYGPYRDMPLSACMEKRVGEQHK